MLYLLGDLFGRKIRFPLGEDCARIAGGAQTDNDLYLPYRGVSRSHFLLEREDGRWNIRDLNSKNGVLLNGVKTDHAGLRDGDVLRLGIIELRVCESPADDTVLPLENGRTAFGAEMDTDEMGPVALVGREEVLAFPHLTFPDGYIPGTSERMLEIYRTLQMAARQDLNILFTGETGVGKEMLAMTLHLSSPNAHGPFIAVNCAAIPAELAETELFGIGDRVATGVAGRIGKIAEAIGGTLFLDEISAFPLPIQAKLLRAVEEKIITPVGARSRSKADFRLMAAGNKDPRELIRQGLLREDFYFRLAGMEITIPPLRERRGDLKGLILGLLFRLGMEAGKPLGGVSKILLVELAGRDYPGNVRELLNMLRTMIARAHPGEILDAGLLPSEFRVEHAEPDDLHALLESTSKDKIIEALRVHENNITRAARHLGISAPGLRKMMKRMKIKKE